MPLFMPRRNPVVRVKRGSRMRSFRLAGAAALGFAALGLVAIAGAGCRPAGGGLTARAPAPGFMPTEEPGRVFAVRNHLPGVVLQNPTFAVMPPRGPRIWFIGEREGRLLAVEDRADAAQASTVLDLRAHTLGWQDTGLLNLVLHPEFGQPGSPNRGFIYVWYNHTLDPHPGPDQPFVGHPSSNRLSRFTIPDGSLRADPASELVLIEQARSNTDHHGGGMFFHPGDGFLYLAVGDGGHPFVESRGVSFTTGTDDPQRIDRDLLSGVLRIDVDRRGPGVSHPIRRQPQHGHTQGYFVPDDNPWTSAAGDVLEEFFAIGLRSPHRMTHDPGSGRIFVGDVGEGRMEEVDVIERAGNYQWNYLEGTLPYAAAPAQVRGHERPPLHAYYRQGRFAAVIGGVAYHGRALPALSGQYLFGENGIGKIFALDARGTGPAAATPVLRLPQEMTAYAGISSFALDREGEVYLCILGQNDQRTGSLQKLVPVRGAPVAPPTLAQTGLFADLGRLTAAPGLFPYEVNAAFWSDHKQKRRWLHVPAGAHIGFRPQGEWDFPAGTIAVKHFDLALDERDPGRTRRLETRVLVLDGTGGAYGRTYKWRTDGTDADLLAGPVTEQLTTVARAPWGTLAGTALSGSGAGRIEIRGGFSGAAPVVHLTSPTDGALFAHVPAAGDFDLGAAFGPMSGGRAGLMLRQGRAAGGTSVRLLWSGPGDKPGRLRIERDSGAAGAPVESSEIAAVGPWLRLRRVDGALAAFSSEDGQLWHAIESVKMNAADATEVGLVVAAKTGVAAVDVTSPVRLLTRDHYYPSGDECMACHTRSAHFVLGASTRQWNRDVLTTAPAGHDNQLLRASRAGLFDADLRPEQVAGWKKLVAIDDGHASLEDRVRSYLDANCSQCHRPGVLAQIRVDFRYDTPLAEQGLIRGLVRNPSRVPHPGELIVVPKDIDRSRLYLHVQRHRMPPLGSLLNNDKALDLLQQWIMSLDGPPALRAVQITSRRAPRPGHFRIELGSPDTGSTIHYTVDGSGPSRETPKYTGPFDVGEQVMIRAVAFKEGFVPSRLALHTVGR